MDSLYITRPATFCTLEVEERFVAEMTSEDSRP